jgi:WD40 repeat protein
VRWVAALAALVLSLAAARADEPAKVWLGVELGDVTKQEADALGLKGVRAAKVLKPVPGGPADKAGLLPGDILLSADGAQVQTMASVVATVRAKAPGAEIKFRLLRAGKEMSLAVTLGVRPAELALPTPKDAPILQLDTGGHMAKIRGVAFTPDGKFIVSAGYDKVIRVWDWRAGAAIRAIRGLSGPGGEGQIFAMALSPDGRWLAVGGRMHPECMGECGDIRLYDLASGELHALLKGHSNVVTGIAFSPEGKKLISGGSDFAAIIWDVERKSIIHRLEGHRDAVYAVGFTPDGARAATASDDNTLRLWGVADGALLKDMTGHRDKVSALAVSQDGRIASGDNSGEIRLWDGKTGALLKVFANQGGYVGSLQFSPDGRLLLSTCGYLGCSPTQRIFDVASGKQQMAYAKHGSTVIASAFSPDGGLIATGGGSNMEIHVWDAKTGETKAVLKGAGKSVSAVGFSADSRSIAWGSGSYSDGARDVNDRGPLEIAFRLPFAEEGLSQPETGTSAKNWVRANAIFGHLSLRRRKGGSYGYEDALLDLLKNGKPSGVTIERAAEDAYGHNAYGFTPDGKAVISGGANGILTAYGLDGKNIGEFIGHEGDVWAVAPSPDGRYLVSGSNDQTVRLWNLKTRELLVTIFRGEDGEWAMWTPQGYYAGSPGADKMIGWQINKGADKAADYVTAEQLRKHLNRPDIVAKAIQLASAEEAVRTSNGTGFRLSDLLARPAPHLRVLSPKGGAAVKTSAGINVKIALAATPDPVTRIRIQVNGRQLDDFLPENGASFAPGEHLFPVPLAKGQNTIVVTALNEIGWSKVQDGTLAMTNETAGDLDKRGTLYILAIGVTKYPGVANLCKPKDTCDLEYTGRDASAFAEAMSARLGPLHDKVVSRVLANGGAADDAPTAANIIDALGLLRDAGPSDTVAVFLAGHGVNDGPNYRFVSTDAALANGVLKPSSVVPWYAIEEAIDCAKGRRLLFIDTCHSAGAYNQRLGNAAYYANILAYSSARWDQAALESEDYRHGLFTYALVEGMGGAADANHDGRVDTAELAEYLRKRVPELAAKLQGEQEPQFFKGRDAEVYPIAALR